MYTNLNTLDRILRHVNPKLPFVIATDSPTYDIAAGLSHVLTDNTKKRICSSSRTFRNAEV